MDYDKYIRENPELLQRPMRSIPLVGDPSKLTAATGWKPQVAFEDMVREMVQHELAARTQGNRN
jgi:GDPmannose 4,6-dehydratase